MNYLALLRRETACPPEAIAPEPVACNPGEDEPQEPPAIVVRPDERPPWNLDETTRYILALSETDREIYRAALAHDTTALARADAVLAARQPQRSL